MEVSNHDVELQAAYQINFSVDLIIAAKRHLKFLRVLAGLPCLRSGNIVSRAIKRYTDFWMPLAAKFGSTEEKTGHIILPPLDVRWIWHCHCLNANAYQSFCKSHYSKIIDAPLFPDDTSEAAAQEKCRLVWADHYPHEPFDVMTVHYDTSVNNLKIASASDFSEGECYNLMESVSRQNILYYQVSQPYMWDDNFLQSARERYKCFLYILHRSEGRFICVPTSDISLMWHAHKLSPVAYACDTHKLLEHVDEHDDELESKQNSMLVQDFKNTSKFWEDTFGQPYERAGSVYHRVKRTETVSLLEALSETVPVTINWQYQDVDVNANLKTLRPRYVIEVCIQIKKTDEVIQFNDETGLFIRLRALEAFRLLKLEKPVGAVDCDMSWQRLWLMQCEMSTKGVTLEIRSPIQGCLGALKCSKLIGVSTLTWEELKRENLLALVKTFVLKEGTNSSTHKSKKLELCLSASMTPPVQAPYLLKSVPDRVTDDSGAMLSNIILRMNKYHPQEGRWISRTVLDHGGKECFVIRIRVARGIWRRKKDQPIGVDWNERVIHIHGGGWKYITGSIGIAPDTLVATATPAADELEQYRMKWTFSTGETLTIQMPVEEIEWQRQLQFTLNDSHQVRLLNGRKMQYQVPCAVPEEEEGFVTLVRYTAKDLHGKATALFNWKVSAMEVLPEEDIVLVMLLCTATFQTVSDLGGTSQGAFFTQRRRQSEPGLQDWGSVVIGGSPDVPSNLSFWFLNPEDVVGAPLSTEDSVSGNIGETPGNNNQFMYRGTSWIYTGGSSGLYKMASRRSSFGRDGGDYVFGAF